MINTKINEIGQEVKSTQASVFDEVVREGDIWEMWVQFSESQPGVRTQSSDTQLCDLSITSHLGH